MYISFLIVKISSNPDRGLVDVVGGLWKSSSVGSLEDSC